MALLLDCYALIIAILTLLIAWSQATALPKMTISASGSGLHLDGRTKASGKFVFPKETSGVSISYWLTSYYIEGDRSMQPLFCLSKGNGPCAISIQYEYETVILQFGTGAQIRATAPRTNEFYHQVMTWNATDGVVRYYDRNYPRPLFNTARGAQARISLSTSRNGTTSCTETTGGYLPEGTACVFPFRVNGEKFHSCVPWSERPFIAQNEKPRPTARLGLAEAPWCSSSEAYSTTDSDTRRLWGFCSCNDIPQDPNAVSIHDEVTLASFSGSVPVVELKNVQLFFFSRCDDIYTTNGINGLAFIEAGSVADCPYEVAATKAQSLERSSLLKAIVFAYTNDSSTALSGDLSKQMENVREVVAKASDVTPASAVDPCISTQMLLDRDVSTTLDSCEWFIFAERAPPFATHYGIVIPANVDMTTWSWSVTRALPEEEKGQEVLVDRRSAADLVDSNFNSSARQYFFDFMPLASDSTRAARGISQEKFRIRFSTSLPTTNCSIFRIAEFGLFSSPRKTLSQASSIFNNGRLVPKSYFSRKMAPNRGGVSSVPTFSTSSDSLLARTLRQLRNGTRVDIKFDMFVKGTKDILDAITSSSSQLIIGDLSSSVIGEPNIDLTPSFTAGGLDELQIFPFALSAAEVENLQYTGIGPTPLSKYNFEKLPPEDAGSAKHNLAVTEGATLNPAEAYGVPSASIILMFRPAETSVRFSMFVPRPVFDDLKVKVAKQPTSGKISGLDVGIASSIGSYYISGTYTRSVSINNWKQDSFSITVNIIATPSISKDIVVSVVRAPDVIPLPAVQTVEVPPATSVTLSLGGIMTSDVNYVAVSVNASQVKLGSVTRLSYCNQKLTGNQLHRHIGMVSIRYSAPANPVQTDVVERVYWQYSDYPEAGRAVVEFVLKAPPSESLSSSSFSITSTAGSNLEFVSTLGPLPIGIQMLDEPMLGSLYRVEGSQQKTRLTPVSARETHVFAHTVTATCSAPGSCSANTGSSEDATGDSDDVGAVLSSSSSLFVTFPVELISTHLVLRLKRANGEFLQRVFLESDQLPVGAACKPFACSAISSNPKSLLTQYCTQDDHWKLAWESSCSEEPATATDSIDSLRWSEVVIPLCSLGIPISTVRLDFGSRDGDDGWVALDSVALFGVAILPDDDPNQAVSHSLGPRFNLRYEPVRGVSGDDRFMYKVQTLDCTASPILTQSLSSTRGERASFAEMQPILTDGDRTSFEIQYDFDYSSALKAIGASIFRVSTSSSQQQLRNDLWAPGSMFQASIIIYSNAGQKVFDETKSAVASFSQTSLEFRKTGLSSDLLKNGGLNVSAYFQVQSAFWSPPAKQIIEFSYTTQLFGSCGQASPELGACSQKGRPYLPQASCEVNPGVGYECNCPKARSPDDIAFAGKFCQYNTFSTCFGRGHPDDDGICRCFESNKFASKQCNKRASNTTRDGLLEELEKTKEKFQFALSVLPGVTDIHVVSTPTAAELVATYGGSTQVTLISLSYATELNSENNCHGNGRPVGTEELDQTDCQCLEEFRPRKTCSTKIICGPGEYILGDECADCPEGFYCDSGVRATPCPNDTFTVSTRSFRCYDNCIEAGYEDSYLVRHNPNNTAIGSCHLCHVGSSCDGVHMTPCPLGTFGSKSLICIACNELGLNTYSDVAGSLSCLPCPEGTIRQDGSPGMSRKECTCKPGMWNGLVKESGVTGVPCISCPSNAICEGPVRLPKQSPNISAVLERARFTPKLLASLQPEGAYRNAKPYPAPGFWGDSENPSAFFACDGACIGGTNFSCARGYTGRMCSLCEEGFHPINGECFECPADNSSSTALVVFGIWCILLLFVMINRASNEVRALEIALLYTQVTNLVQQFSFVWPSPVNALNNIYAVTDFDIDFVTFECALTNVTWTFQDRFYTQWFFVWYVGAFVILVNFFAYRHAKAKEKKAFMAIQVEAASKLKTQHKRAALAAARVGKLRSRQSLEFEGFGTSSPAPPVAMSGVLASPEQSIPDRGTTTSPATTVGSPPVFSDRFLDESVTTTNKQPADIANGKQTTWWQRLCCCMFCRKMTKQESAHDLEEEDENADPRIQAIKRWLKRTLGLPRSQTEYVSYTNGQWNGWFNLVRVVYNSLLIVCLSAFACITLADGTQVMSAWPEDQCGTSSHAAMVVFGVIGLIIYGLGVPGFVYFVLTRAAKADKKADLSFQERYGLIYTGFRQEHYRWELMILFRRFAMCVLVVGGDGYPYIQAVLGASVLVLCLGMHLYHQPYLSARINTLETVVLSSILFYLLCGTVFTGLNDLILASELDPTMQEFAESFSTALSYILLIISVLTVVVCFIVFFMDLKEYFNVLIVERSLVKKAKSEDVALIRVLRADKLKMPSGSIKQLTMPSFRRDKSATVPDAASPEVTRARLTKSGSKIIDSVKRKVARGGSSTGSKKRPHRASALFDKLDMDHSSTLSREELLVYANQALGLPKDLCRARIEDLFDMFDLDESDSVDINEFYAITMSAMPLATDCELKRTIKPKFLIEWVEKSALIKPLSVALFFELDEAVRSAIADNSPLSAYRDNSRATFFRSLATAFPYMIDWLASAPPHQVDALKEILTSLRECRDTLGESGSFARMAVEIDRGPLIGWLLDAQPRERAVFRAVFKTIADANTDNGRHLTIWGDADGDLENMPQQQQHRRRKMWHTSSQETPAVHLPATSMDGNGTQTIQPEQQVNVGDHLHLENGHDEVFASAAAQDEGEGNGEQMNDNGSDQNGTLTNV